MTFSSPCSRRPHPASRSELAVLTSTRLLFMARFAGCATTHQPCSVPVPELLMSKPTGAAGPHHQRQHIPRKIPRVPQVLCARRRATLRGAGTLRRLSAARCGHRHPHLRRRNLRHPHRRPLHDARLRGRVASSSLRALLRRLLFRSYSSPICASMWPLRRLRAHSRRLRSGRLRCRGPRRPLYELLGLQRRQQRRCAERSNARAPPTEPACRPISALSSPRPGDSFVPCWCWQVGETPPSHAA